jgi:hypothetical protein
MHERTEIRLSARDRRELEAVVANRNSPQKHVWRAKIVLLTADGWSYRRMLVTEGIRRQRFELAIRGPRFRR